jgi:hypothetical protein
MSDNNHRENNGSYQKFTCIINNVNLDSSHTRIDTTKDLNQDTPRLQRLHKINVMDDIEDTHPEYTVKTDDIAKIKSYLSQSMSFLESITYGQYRANLNFYWKLIDIYKAIRIRDL